MSHKNNPAFPRSEYQDEIERLRLGNEKLMIRLDVKDRQAEALAEALEAAYKAVNDAIASEQLFEQGLERKAAAASDRVHAWRSQARTTLANYRGNREVIKDGSNGSKMIKNIYKENTLSLKEKENLSQKTSEAN